MTTAEQFQSFLDAVEGSHFEYKEAKSNYQFDHLVQYCVALANEGGGKILLGITDRRPRTVIGTEAFPEPGRTESGIFQRLNRRVVIEEYEHEDKRVLIIHVPSRPVGSAWSDNGIFWMRAGDSLIGMTDEQLQLIHMESAPDFSAQVCPAANLSDLDPSATARFRTLWANKTGNQRILSWTNEQTLAGSELIIDNQITYAALILFGTRASLGRHLAQAEVIFEYRSSEAAGPSPDRIEHREGFLFFNDQLWDHINKRNDHQSYQDGFFRYDIPTFDEKVIREAILNAVSHRDYRLGGSVFVRQFPRRLEVISPGGFPPGITPDNILDQQNPRNRRLAEALAKCGLIERAGQGMNIMFERSVLQSKPLPDFSGSAAHEVRLTLQGTVTNAAFVRFLEKVGERTMASFDTHDLLVLDFLQRDEEIPSHLRPRVRHLLQSNVVESIGRGRGTRYLLSRRFYAALGQKGAYTRRIGLDREAHKELLVKHIQDNAHIGSPISELHQVVPSLSFGHLKRLLVELKNEGRIRLHGARRGSRWFPGRPATEEQVPELVKPNEP
jgi:ATP-dependent DNA helicase RecG